MHLDKANAAASFAFIIKQAGSYHKSKQSATQIL